MGIVATGIAQLPANLRLVQQLDDFVCKVCHFFRRSPDAHAFTQYVARSYLCGGNNWHALRHGLQQDQALRFGAGRKYNIDLGDVKMTIRGLSHSSTVFSFDGIPFNDTNGVSHHSWVFFPSQFLGGAVVDRSPGGASTIGQATFGGSADLKSRVLEAQPRTSATLSAGSWNTNLVGIEHETGQFRNTEPYGE